MVSAFYVASYQTAVLAGYYTELKNDASQRRILTLKDFGYGN